jgi:hypothetical protein
MGSTHAALVIALAMGAAVVAMIAVFAVAGRAADRNAMSREHLERDGAYGEEGLRRAKARHDEHE